MTEYSKDFLLIISHKQIWDYLLGNSISYETNIEYVNINNIDNDILIMCKYTIYKVEFDNIDLTTPYHNSKKNILIKRLSNIQKKIIKLIDDIDDGIITGYDRLNTEHKIVGTLYIYEKRLSSDVLVSELY